MWAMIKVTEFTCFVKSFSKITITMTFDSAFDSICETVSVIIDTDLSLKMLSRLLILSNVIVSNLGIYSLTEENQGILSLT